MNYTKKKLNLSTENVPLLPLVNAFSLLKPQSIRNFYDFPKNRVANKILFDELIAKMKSDGVKGFTRNGGKDVFENMTQILYDLSTFHDKMNLNYHAPIPEYFSFSNGANDYNKKHQKGFQFFQFFFHYFKFLIKKNKKSKFQY